MVIVVSGVAGAGKTTVGRALALRLRCDFVDADDFHAPASVEKMRRGVALDDEDREPWLRALAAEIRRSVAEGRTTVLACSALRARYRALLREGTAPGAVRFVFLDVPGDLAAARLRSRSGHFATETLVESQLEALEEPPHDEALRVDATERPDALVERIANGLGLP